MHFLTLRQTKQLVYILIVYITYVLIGIVGASYIKIIWVAYGDTIRDILYSIFGFLQLGSGTI